MLVITDAQDIIDAEVVLKDYLRNNKGVKYNDVVYYNFEQLKSAVCKPR